MKKRGSCLHQSTELHHESVFGAAVLATPVRSLCFPVLLHTCIPIYSTHAFNVERADLKPQVEDCPFHHGYPEVPRPYIAAPAKGRRSPPRIQRSAWISARKLMCLKLKRETDKPMDFVLHDFWTNPCQCMPTTLITLILE